MDAAPEDAGKEGREPVKMPWKSRNRHRRVWRETVLPDPELVETTLSRIRMSASGIVMETVNQKRKNEQPNKKGMEVMEEKKSSHDPLRISAPWQEFRNKLAALFAQDPQIKVEEVEASDDPAYDYEMDICAYSHVKANALMELLGNTARFGMIQLKILIYDMENGTTASTRARLYRDLFEGNSVFDSIQLHANSITGMEHAYVLFKPEALQYFDDDLQDPRGNASILPQDIARDVFKNDSWATTGVSFCTAEVATKEDHDGETESAGQ